MKPRGPEMNYLIKGISCLCCECDSLPITHAMIDVSVGWRCVMSFLTHSQAVGLLWVDNMCVVCVCFCMPLAPCDNCVTHSHTNHAANNKWVRPHMRGTIEMCALCSTVLCCGLVISSLPPAAVHGVAMANVTVFYVCGALMKTEILSSTSQRCPSICTYEIESSVIVLGLVIGHK